MTNLIVHAVKYRDQIFTMHPTNVADMTNYGVFTLKEFDWYHVETKTDITKYAFRHGSKVGATSNGVRTFHLTFTAFASDEQKRFQLIKLVSSIFNPPSIMSDTEGFHDLEFLTPDGVRWTTKAQTTTRPKMFDYNNQHWVTFQVELVSQGGSLLYSKHKTTITDTNTRMGVRLNNLLAHRHQYYKDEIPYQGTNDAPLHLTIRATKTVSLPWLYIRTYNGGKLLTTMELEALTLNEGDTLTIDSINETITKSNNSGSVIVNNLLSLNSERPRLLAPVTSKWVMAIVDCWLLESCLELQWSYHEVRD